MITGLTIKSPDIQVHTGFTNLSEEENMSKTPNIVFFKVYDIDEKLLDRIKAAAPGASITITESTGITPEALKKAEIIFGWMTHEQINNAENLKWLHLPSAGADGHTDKALYRNQDIILTNSSGVFGMPIAEHILAMILSFNRDLHIYSVNKSENKWARKDARKDFFGSTTGIIGLGDIGTEVAVRAKALGSKVIAVKRTPVNKPDYVDELYGEDNIDYLLEQSDYVVLALPHTRKTQGIISEVRLRKMKRDAFIVNVGRGALIDQDALIKALSEGWIAGAGLDVTSPEPLPAESPLWGMPNVILTPHVSGSSPTNIHRVFDIFLENLKRYVNGDLLINRVDFDEQY